MKRFLRALSLAAALAASQAASQAQAGALAVTPGSGATLGMGSDGTNLVPGHVICGAASATLYATCLYQVYVNSSGAMLIDILSGSEMATLLQAPPNVSVASTPTAWTGHTVNGSTAGDVNLNSVNGAALDPCLGSVKSNFSIATSAGNLQLVAPVSGKKVYICSLFVIGAAASVQNIIEGTGAACTTANEAAVIGSTTAASGLSFAANGGFTYGGGGSTLGATATTGNGLCLLQSGTTALAGNVTYIQQ